MTPDRCPCCGSPRLHEGTLVAQHPVRFRLSFWRTGGVRAFACLDCGAIRNFLDEKALARLRQANGLEELPMGRKVGTMSDF